MRALLMAVCIIAGLAAVAPAGARDGVHLSANLAATLKDCRARPWFEGLPSAEAIDSELMISCTLTIFPCDARFSVRPRLR